MTMMNTLNNRAENALKRVQELLAKWLTPHSLDTDKRFTERNLRLIVLVSWIAFPLIALSDLYRGAEIASMEWVFIVFGVLALAVIALQRGKPNLAGGVMWLALLTLPFDNAAVYWSPGTIILTLLFTLFSLLILPINRRLILPLAFNLGIYIAIIFIRRDTPSPFPPDNTFSEPLSSFIAVAMAHLCIIVLVYFIRRDQSERDKLLLLVEEERADVLRQFLTNASHDLKTPLTKMKLTTYLLKRTVPDDHQSRVADLDASVTHLETTLEGMFEMSRLDSAIDFQLNQIDLLPFISQIVASFQSRANAKNQTLRYEIENGDLTTYADSDHLQRAFANILENALTYTPENGTISLHVRRESAHIVVEICDTGIGIPADELPRIFDRFYRGDAARNTSTGKSGLGLAISKRIVMLHRGTIAAESHPNEGSRFTITLPAASSVV